MGGGVATDQTESDVKASQRQDHEEKAGEPESVTQPRPDLSTRAIGYLARVWVERGEWLQILGAIIALVAGLVASVGSFYSSRSTVTSVSVNDDFRRLIAVQDEKIQTVISQIRELQRHIASISNIPTEDALYLELRKLNVSFSDLNSREAKIESVILENPSRALEMPLLRRDLDNVRESQQASLVSVKESVDRIYDLNKWLLGAMAVSIVTLAAGNLLKGKGN
jgi:hypothetical protein